MPGREEEGEDEEDYDAYEKVDRANEVPEHLFRSVDIGLGVGEEVWEGLALECLVYLFVDGLKLVISI